jgi:hypothetical protein
MNMLIRKLWPAACALALVSLAGAAIAGEVTGNQKKEDFSQGSSICKFSGLNDIPQGDPEEGPAGRTQNYGHDGADLWADPNSLDPDGGFQMHPGWLCNPSNLDVSGR